MKELSFKDARRRILKELQWHPAWGVKVSDEGALTLEFNSPRMTRTEFHKKLVCWIGKKKIRRLRSVLVTGKNGLRITNAEWRVLYRKSVVAQRNKSELSYLPNILNTLYLKDIYFRPRKTKIIFIFEFDLSIEVWPAKFKGELWYFGLVNGKWLQMTQEGCIEIVQPPTLHPPKSGGTQLF